MVYIAPDDY
jgi:hypothetical protein